MPAISPRDLVDAITSAIEDSGYSALLLSNIRQHPRRFIISKDGESAAEVWVYAWTLTPGGRPSLPYEYRIQMTSVPSPPPMNPRGPTVLVGYEPSLMQFAGFDLVKHQIFTTGSPSVQIDIRTVQKALQDGLAFDRKSNDEIAVGVRPDHFVDYCSNAVELHRLGKLPGTFRLLELAAALEPISDVEVSLLSESRKSIVSKVSRLSRKGNFRKQVLSAYDHRCAVTRCQLRLVDAAHILPVGAPDSSDDVRNGIALSPTYHRAYDNGLIFLDDSRAMRINAAKVDDLRRLDIAGGLDAFSKALGKIHLPPDRKQWPNIEAIRMANRFRRIAV